MTEIIPKMEAHSLGFFSEWYVRIIWPDGRHQRVDGFKNEAHAKAWIEHEAKAWLVEGKPPGL
jgi:hypothetical protein